MNQKQSPPTYGLGGLCFLGSQNGYPAPEIKEGLVHRRNPTSQNLSYFFFFLAFFLAFFFAAIITSF
jgi:hypothetical protein